MEERKCKKILFKSYGNNTRILLGVIIGESEYFILFKTAKKEYQIAKNSVVSIEDTNEIFQERYSG